MIKLFKQFTRISLVIILFSSCAKVFYSPDAYMLAHKHKSIAILPPEVTITVKKKVDEKALKEQQKIESLNFQKELYAWLLKRKSKGKPFPEIVDIETTNAKLKKAGYPEKPLSPAELCEVLGVDGILISNFDLSKPLSEKTAVVVGLLSGMYGPTNEVRVSLSIFDKSKQKQIWNYNHRISGGITTTPYRLVDALMKDASKKMPYMK